MHIKCSLIDEQGNCRILHQPAAEGCKCPHYQTTEIQKCGICGRAALKMPLLQTKGNEWKYICGDCYKQLDTCALCAKHAYCAFKQDPSPIPLMVMQTVQKGPMLMQTQVPNPDRVAATCKICACWNTELEQCNRAGGFCSNYQEVEI